MALVSELLYQYLLDWLCPAMEAGYKRLYSKRSDGGNFNGEHWHKRVSVFGIPLYHRHDFTKDAEKKTVGFSAMAGVSGEIEDEEYWKEEDNKHKQSW